MGSNKKTLFAFAVVSILLGVNFIFIKLTNRELPPFASAAIRFLLASIVLMVVARIKKLPIPNFKDSKIPILYGVLTFGLNSGLLYWGLQGSSSEIASVIYSSVPLTTILLTSIVNLQKLSKVQLVSSLIVILGITVIFYSQLNLEVSPLRLLAILLASIFAASSTILVKSCSYLHPISLNFVAMLTGSLTLMVISLFNSEIIYLPIQSITWISLTWLILSSCVAFVLMSVVIKNWSPVKASYSSVIIPLVTICVGILTSHNSINLNTLIGSSIVVSGVGFQLFKKY